MCAANAVCATCIIYVPAEVNAVDLLSDAATDRGLLDTLLTVLPEFGFNRIWAASTRHCLRYL